MKFKLRDYQTISVDNIRKSFGLKKTAPLLALPTGGGKTVIFTYIAENAAAKGRKVLILAHRKELIRQASLKLLDFGVNAGVIAPGYTYNPMAMVQVASVQTLVRRLNINWEPDLIVVDEAHHTTATTYTKILDNYPKAKVLGVTATPCRSDGAGLGDIFDDLVLGPSMKWLIEEGYLSDYRAFSHPIKFNVKDLKLTAGDFNQKDMAAELDRPTIIGDAVEHYKEICPGEPAIAFCFSVDHAEHVANTFREAGFNFHSVDGKTPPEIRDKLISSLADGSIHGLCSCDIISEGTDIPVVTAAILLRPTMSEGLFLQQVGRALRPVYADGYDLNSKEGRLAAQKAGPKPNAYILDHVGNIRRHGLPDEDRNWRLERTKEKKKKDEENVNIKVCDQCFGVVAAVAKICYNCGNVFVSTEGTGEGRDVDERSGQLEEIKKTERQLKLKEQGEAETLSELMIIERERGYRKGWAQKIYKSRQVKKAYQEDKLAQLYNEYHPFQLETDDREFLLMAANFFSYVARLLRPYEGVKGIKPTLNRLEDAKPIYDADGNVLVTYTPRDREELKRMIETHPFRLTQGAKNV